MKKERENQPLDNLFARKLGNLSVPPSAGGFERLQAKMTPNKPTRKVVFWQSSSFRRYVAVAACMTLVCLIGWLYLPLHNDSRDSSIAVRLPKHPPKEFKAQTENLLDKIAYQEQLSNIGSRKPSDQRIINSSRVTEDNRKLVHVPAMLNGNHSNIKQSTLVYTDQIAPTMTRVQPIEGTSKLNESSTVVADNVPAAHIAENATKSASSPERVLIVTIEEPTILAEARQGRNAPEEKSMIALEEKPAKEVKTGGVWQKMKQLKQGELVAKSDNLTNDDQGLLSRAYTGLKHSIEKSKISKQ